MAQLLDPIKNFFSSEGQPKTQKFLRLQFLEFLRSTSKHPTTSKSSKLEGDDLEFGARLEPNNGFLASLYLLLRFIKIISSASDDRFPGWRSGIAGFTILASCVLILNISALIWTATNLDDGHYATLATGSYEDISNLLGWVQFCGANVLSTILLAGSNYCMQCLSSPTRAEVDAAHARGSYLSIGTLSWRNVFASRKRRICLLLLLTLTSVVMHSVYNTSIVMTTALHSYASAVITPDFKVLPYDLFAQTNDTVPIIYTVEHNTDRLDYIQNLTANTDLWDTSLWKNISAEECAREKVFQTETTTLLIVANVTLEQILSNQDPRLLPFGSSFYSHALPSWLQNRLYPVYQSLENDRASTSKGNLPISYCLRRKMPGLSRLQIHFWLLLTATILNAIKLCCLLFTFKEQQGIPLVTTGDAIASFLTSRCAHSAGMCMLSQEELAHKLQKRRDDNEVYAIITHKKFKKTQLRYYRSVNLSRWVVYITSVILIMLFSVNRYGHMKKQLQYSLTSHDLRSLWNIGFGNLNEHSLIGTKICDLKFPGLYNHEKYRECEDAYGGASAMILANLPQLIVSAIYLCLNHQLTLMVQLGDWARLASYRQPLRVSDPEPASDQVSTYWLSLPYRYSIPLLLTSALLSWLVSQTLFIVRYAVYNESSMEDIPNVSHALGFSAIALIFAFALGLVIFGVSVAIGLCKCAPGMPLGPSNSLVIAAACHPPERDRYAARKMVKWGAVSTGDNTGEVNSPHHCTITSRRVEDPVEGRWYG